MSAWIAIEQAWRSLRRHQTTGDITALKRDATDGVQSIHVSQTP